MDDVCQVRFSNLEDVDYLSMNLREIDQEELKILNVDSRYALAFPFTQKHSISYTIICNDLPLGMFGTIPAKNNEARVWMLCSDDFEKHYMEICRNVKDFVELLQVGYSCIYNVVPVHNKRTIRFLRFAGFTISDTLEINDVKFVKFFRCNLKFNNVYNDVSRPVMH